MASCAYEHGLLGHKGHMTEVIRFSRIWVSKFGINPLIKELLRIDW